MTFRLISPVMIQVENDRYPSILEMVSPSDFVLYNTVLLSSIIVAQVRFTPFSFLFFSRNIFKPKHAFMFLFAFILCFAHIRNPFLVGWLNFSQLTWLTCWFVMLWRTFVVYLKIVHHLCFKWFGLSLATSSTMNNENKQFFFFSSFWTMRLEMCIAFYISLHFKNDCVRNNGKKLFKHRNALIFIHIFIACQF